MTGEALVVLCTIDDESAAVSLAKTLIEEQNAACVNLVPNIRSFYRWEGATHEDNELLLVIKTTQGAYAALEARITALHPYDVPEIIALPVSQGVPSYLSWLTGSVTPS